MYADPIAITPSERHWYFWSPVVVANCDIRPHNQERDKVSCRYYTRRYVGTSSFGISRERSFTKPQDG
jgi:hypothetical protein